MRVLWLLPVVVLPMACATAKVPVAQLASSGAAIRSAEEMGANEVPQAAHHLQLAKRQTEQANKLMSDGKDRRAAFLLERATVDAELALSLAREEPTRREAERLMQRVQLLQKRVTP